MTWRAAILVCLAMGAGWCAPAAAAQPPSAPEPIVTTSREFKVPFVIEPDADVRPDAVELLVSTDHGQSWHTAQVAALAHGGTTGKFAFLAPFDGEYWFCIRGVARRGRTSPAEQPEPELRVLVVPANRADLASAVAPLETTTPSALEPEFAPVATGGGEIRPRMVNSRTLDIDYDAPTGVDAPREVAVWLTRNGGQTWQRHEVDADRRSPARITVDRDGLYGLWIVITDAAGQRTAEPRSGDAPGVWIGIDTAAPRTRLLTAETAMVRGQRALTVRWQADDARLALAPVTLRCRGAAEEPWRTLATGLMNTGNHTFPIPSTVTDSVYLQIEVLDEAGNVAVVETDEPVSTVATVPNHAPREHATLRGSRTYQVLR